MISPMLSIIIPAYNEEHRLPQTLLKIKDFIQAQEFETEVIVVENGSADRTLQIASDFAKVNSWFRVIHEEQRGKGLAIRRGMLEARGDFRFMCDADLSMPAEEIRRFIPPSITQFDLAIGSREAAGAHRYDEPFYRHIGGRAINLMIRLLALPGLHDTQCGFKCFRGEVAEDLFRTLTLTGWSFDIEVLYIARKRGYCIIEIPIPWFFNPDSKLSLIKDTLRMGWDLLRIRQNDWRGLYQPRINAG